MDFGLTYGKPGDSVFLPNRYYQTDIDGAMVTAFQAGFKCPQKLILDGRFSRRTVLRAVASSTAGESTATDPGTRELPAPRRPEFAPYLPPDRLTSKPGDRTSAHNAARCHSRERTPESQRPRCAPPALQT